MEFQCKEDSSIVGYGDNDNGGSSNVPSLSRFFHPYDFAHFTASVVPFFFFFFFQTFSWWFQCFINFHGLKNISIMVILW